MLMIHSLHQYRFGGGGHVSPKDRNKTNGLGGPSPGMDQNENSMDNPYLWDPHYMPCEESDYERHHYFLLPEEKDRYAIPKREWAHTLDEKETLERITNIVKSMERAQTDGKIITLQTHLYNDLGLDSLDAVEFGLACEDEFEIELQDEEAEQIVTIGDAVELICEHPTAA